MNNNFSLSEKLAIFFAKSPFFQNLPPENWNTELRKNFVEGCKAFFQLVEILHLSDRHVMKQDVHVEMESKNWACVFHIINRIMSVAHLIKLWCHKDKASLNPIFNSIMEKLAIYANTKSKTVTFPGTKIFLRKIS